MRERERERERENYNNTENTNGFSFFYILGDGRNARRVNSKTKNLHRIDLQKREREKKKMTQRKAGGRQAKIYSQKN